MNHTMNKVMYQVNCDTFSQWRAAARKLLVEQVTPDAVQWNSTIQINLFEANTLDTIVEPTIENTPKIPQAFILEAEKASCLRDGKKWSRLYRIAWRIVNENRHLLKVKADDDVRWLHTALRAINRDCHKMKAFVRFVQAPTESPNDREIFYAWFEPEHLIVERMANFFRNRFTGMTWSILTPDRCCHWDGEQITLSEGIQKPKLKQDDCESLWLDYYSSIFNPARLKEQAMLKEMPKRYWKNLPEAKMIKQLIAASEHKTTSMLNAPLLDPNALRNKSKALAKAQDTLRKSNA